MLNKIVVAAVALMGAAYAAPAGAWTLLGVREVNDRTERDEIVLPGPRDYRQIKFCVARNPVEFHDIDVYFGNGGHQDIAVRERVPAGACTRDIDLAGADRNITRIVFRYEESSARRARATVRVFGRG